MPDAKNAALKAAQQNQALRTTLLATAPRMKKSVGTFNGPNTQSARFKLFNVGIITKLTLFVSAALTIGTAVAVPSPKAPWNLIQKVRISDYDNTDRVNLSGFQLFMLNCVRSRTLFGYNNEAATAVMTNPKVPTAVASDTLQFWIDIPLAYDVDNPLIQFQDLRGSILAQTAVGEMYVNIDWNQSLYTNTDNESVYFGAGTTTVVGNGANFITATLWQHYLLPQNVGGPNGGIPLPGIDLMTVYELNGTVRTSDNLAVGAEKLLNYPNVRSVIGIYFTYVAQQLSATGMAIGNVTGIRLIANGNNILQEDTNLSHLFEQRKYTNSDTVAGAYFKTHREKPIETALYGNVQIGFTPAVVGTNANLELGVESFYTKGAALPGLVQGT